MPPKVGVYPRPGALLEAMPAWWRSRDVVGVKWVSAYPGNRARGRDQVQGLIVLNDPKTGTPLCVMDARAITAARTAAASAFAVQLFGRSTPFTATALLGAGSQAKAHLSALIPLGVIDEVRIYDIHPDRATALASWAHENGLRAAPHAVSTVAEALHAAELIVSCASLGPQRQALKTDDVQAARLMVAIDDDMYVSSDVVAACALFVVDDIRQFNAFRARGEFPGFREPDASLGECVSGDRQDRPADGLVVVSAIGVGIADLVFAAAILDIARSSGRGRRLPS
jgi:alanine dehydrogenase